MSANLSPNTVSLAGAETNEILSLFSFGFDHWLVRHKSDEVLERLQKLESNPLSRVQLNQLLHLSHEPGISTGFFDYYWLTSPDQHPYSVSKIPGYSPAWTEREAIESLEHLKWGLYRFYVDALLFFGDIKHAFHNLRALSHVQLTEFFNSKRFDTTAMRRRGPALPLTPIAKDNRYLIAEQACKSYASQSGKQAALKTCLLEAFSSHQSRGGGRTTIRKLLDPADPSARSDRQREFLFSADDILDEEVENAAQIEEKFGRVAKVFETARIAALKNTRYFLSMANDLDVYVATSMRNRDDFRKMADFCDRIFKAEPLKHLSLRYFDPTISAAEGHEDKGLIECLMVKSAKVLIYHAGDRESWGKDAEAAMALSLGKPVIFFCEGADRERLFNEVHPLSRLIHFESGVAVGALVTSSHEEVIELLIRLFENQMEYELESRESGLRLIEKLTNSTFRIQTSDPMLRETFWNYYHWKV